MFNPIESFTESEKFEDRLRVSTETPPIFLKKRQLLIPGKTKSLTRK